MKNESDLYLNFKLNPFLTTVWVSDHARHVWEKRFRQLSSVILTTTVKGVHQHKWDCRTLVVPGWLYLEFMALLPDYAVQHTAHFLGDENIKGPTFYKLIIHNKENGNIPAEAIPACCRPVNRNANMKNNDDHVWDTAVATPGKKMEAAAIELPESSLKVALWRNLGLSLFAHHLCHFQCTATTTLVDDHLQWMSSLGYAEEAGFLKEIFSWPVAWSSLHGICELSAPVVKMAFNGKASGTKQSIRFMGDAYPEEGAYGHSFPFRKRPFLKISDSKAFKRGLEHINQNDADA